MKLPTDFPELDNLLQQLGVPFRRFVPPEIEQSITAQGVTVGSEDIEVAPNGTLEYQGRKVVLYIRDVRGSLPKYHVVDCLTLRNMRQAGRYRRYVVTRRTDGEFLLNFADNLLRENPETHRLDICKNCLWEELDLKDVYKPDNFPLADWFNAIDPGYEPPPMEMDGHRLFGPITTPVTDPISNYPPNWNLLSFQCRDRANWKCEECCIDLRLERKFLHAHHLRGTQYNQPGDLRALCIGCHATQRNHGHMKNSPDYQNFMEKYGETWQRLTSNQQQ